MHRPLLAAIVVLGACAPAIIKTDGGSTSDGGSSDAGEPVYTGPVPTWHKDISPIVQAHCLTCHVTGNIGPFPLDTYARAKPFARSMADATRARRMPPWLASETCGGPFVGERRLTTAQIDAIGYWAQEGAPEGNPADAQTIDAGSEMLARVDQTLKMPVAYTPSASLTDDYRCFLLDPALTEARAVTGYTVDPDQRAEVHHVILYVVDKADATAEDAKDATPGWQCFGGAGINSEGAIGAWAPGVSAVNFPAGTGVVMAAGKVLAMQVHYNTAAGRTADQSSVKLQYAPSLSGLTPAYMLPLAAAGFAIPPNTNGYRFTRDFPNTVAVLGQGIALNVWGLLPHMHTKGVTITMKGPGDTCLVDIPRWDFHWQAQYFRQTPFRLNPNGAINLSCSWDNPTSRTIRWGEGTDDEMCFAFVYATPAL